MSRPSVFGETLNLRLSTKMLKAIEAHAVFNGVVVSEMARRLLRDAITERALVEEWDEEEFGDSEDLP